MKLRLKQAVEEGILLGVKYSIVALLLMFALNDYFETRRNGLMGKASYEFIKQQVEAQSKAQGTNKEGTK